MRPRRCRASGKSERILGLIETDWDAIERDFARLGLDARDWLRGLKPWDQFLNLADMCANTDGSWLWAAQLTDESRLAQWEQLYENAQRNKGDHRPSLAGYDAVLGAINGLRNDFRVANRMPIIPGPKSPMDLITDRRKAVSKARLDKLLGDE